VIALGALSLRDSGNRMGQFDSYLICMVEVTDQPRFRVAVPGLCYCPLRRRVALRSTPAYVRVTPTYSVKHASSLSVRAPLAGHATAVASVCVR